jgi:hypothetical protein
VGAGMPQHAPKLVCHARCRIHEGDTGHRSHGFRERRQLFPVRTASAPRATGFGRLLHRDGLRRACRLNPDGVLSGGETVTARHAFAAGLPWVQRSSPARTTSAKLNLQGEGSRRADPRRNRRRALESKQLQSSRVARNSAIAESRTCEHDHLFCNSSVHSVWW